MHTFKVIITAGKNTCLGGVLWKYGSKPFPCGHLGGVINILKIVPAEKPFILIFP